MRNFAQVEGRLGADAETNTTPKNRKVTRFSVAINETWKRNGKRQCNTTWVRIAAWEKLSEFAAKLKKGDAVQVQGRLSISEYIDRQNVHRQSVEIVASSIRKLDLMRGSADNDVNLGEENESESAAS